jgi:precorrin-6B methylase 2
MSVVNLMISIDDEHMGDISSIAQKLRKIGLRESQLLGEIGVITGTIDENAMSKLSDISGVAAIERQRMVYKAEPKAKARKFQSAA